MIELYKTVCQSGALLAYVSSPTDGRGNKRSYDPVLLHGRRQHYDAFASLSNRGDNLYHLIFSWSEPAVSTDDVLSVAMGRHEDFLAGLPDDHLEPPLVYFHRRRRGCDAHALWWRAHLKTGKRFRFFSETFDFRIKDAATRIANLKHGWTCPSERGSSLHNALPPSYRGERALAWEFLNEQATQLAGAGLVGKPEDFLPYFSQLGFRASLHSDDRLAGLLVEHPCGKVELLGGKYAPGFDYSAAIAQQHGPTSRNPVAVRAELSRLEVKLNEDRQLRRADIARRFPSAQHRFAPSIDVAQELNPPSVPPKLRDYGFIQAILGRIKGFVRLAVGALGRVVDAIRRFSGAVCELERHAAEFTACVGKLRDAAAGLGETSKPAREPVEWAALIRRISYDETAIDVHRAGSPCVPSILEPLRPNFERAFRGIEVPLEPQRKSVNTVSVFDVPELNRPLVSLEKVSLPSRAKDLCS